MEITASCDRTPSHSTDFSPTGHLLASAGTDCTIKLWNSDPGHLLQTLQGHQSWVGTIAFHPHEHLLALASTQRIGAVQAV